MKASLWIILGITIPSFVLFYGFQGSGGGQPTAVPTQILVTLDTDLGEVELTRNDLERAQSELVQEYARMGQLLGASPDQVRQIANAAEREVSRNLREVADYAIGQEALNTRLIKEEIRVTDEQVTELLRLQGITRDQLRTIVQQQYGGSEYAFARVVRETIRKDMARQTVSKAAKVSLLELWNEYLLSNENLTVSYAEVPSEDSSQFTATEEEARAEFEKLVEKKDPLVTNPDRYVYEYVSIPAPRRSLLMPTEEQIKEAYEAAPADDIELAQDPGAQVRQVLIATSPAYSDAQIEAARERAESARQRIASGEDFAAVANEMSEDQRNLSFNDAFSSPTLLGGLLPTSVKGQEIEAWGTEWIAFVNEAEPGDVSPVIETPQGFAVVRVEERLSEGKKPLEKVRQVVERRVSEKLRQDQDAQREEAIAKNLEKLRDALATETTMAGIARQISGQVRYSSPTLTTTQFIQGVGDLSREREALRALGETGISPVLQTSDGTVVVLRVGEELPESSKPFEQVRTQLLERVKQLKAADAAKEKAEALKLEVANGDNLTSRGMEMGITAETLEPFPRQSPPFQLMNSLQLPQQIISANQGDILVVPIGSEDLTTGYFVVHIQNVDAPSREQFLKDFQNLEQQYLSAKRDAYVQEYRSEAKDRLEVEYNEEYFASAAD